MIRYILILLLFVGCTDYQKNHEKVERWVNEHEKPIIVSGTWMNLATNAREYTLICKEGHIYQTPKVRFLLPDTLR